jgi:hypothetical protein
MSCNDHGCKDEATGFGTAPYEYDEGASKRRMIIKEKTTLPLIIFIAHMYRFEGCNLYKVVSLDYK